MFRVKNNRFRRRRKGVTIVEVLILMMVLGISIWAIMSTATWSTELQAATRSNINARILASSWFEVFESINPKPLPPEPPFNMQTAAAQVAQILDPDATGSYASGFSIQGFKVIATEMSTVDGVRSVNLSIEQGMGVAPFSIQKRVNSRSSETVSDDRRG